MQRQPPAVATVAMLLNQSLPGMYIVLQTLNPIFSTFSDAHVLLDTMHEHVMVFITWQGNLIAVVEGLLRKPNLSHSTTVTLGFSTSFNQHRGYHLQHVRCF